MIVSIFFGSIPVQAQVDLSLFDNARLGQVLVKFKGERQAHLVKFDNNLSAARAMAEFSQDEAVDFVQPNFLYETASAPNDTEVASQTYFQTINAFQGWDIVNDASDVVVAVIDSGVDQTHPDIKDNLWHNIDEIPDNGKDDDGNGFVDDVHGWDFLSDVPDASPKIRKTTSESSIGVQHGTVVAGMIGGVGNNNLGITGVAWRVQIMNLRVLGIDGLGDSQAITEAFAYAIDNGADVINMSLVGTDFDQLMVNLLADAKEKNIIPVAAAGNNGRSLNGRGTYPVCYKNHGPATVIGVGATDDNLVKAGFSNFGNNCVDIVAPGVDVFSTRTVRPHFPNQNYFEAIFSGTSFSTPLVSGAIALMKAIYPDMSADDALLFLQQGATPITDEGSKAFGFEYGLNVKGSLDLLLTTVEELPPVPEPEFLALPRAPYHTFGYRYQMPGPILLTPLVLENEELAKGGINITKESATTVLLSRWSADSKTIYRYHTELGTIEEVFRTDAVTFNQSVGSIAIGNVDFDFDDEYVVVGGPESVPMVTIFRGDGVLKYQFRAYADDIEGGMHVALFDTNGDGISEIVTVPATEGPGLIRVFDYTGLMLSAWKAYGDNFNGGANLTIADVTGDGIQELVIGPGVTGGPHVKVFSGAGDLVFEFFGGDVEDNGGAHVQVLDLDRDLQKEYVITYHEGHIPVIRRYTFAGEFIDELGIFDEGYSGGVTIIAD